MRIRLYQVDAFTNRVFGGNPAAVCIIDEWLEDVLMQQIAAENNLSETAFAVKLDNAYEIRWFTPNSEVDLCGHATLATAHVLFEHYQFPGEKIIFQSMTRGELAVLREGEFLTLDFPADPPEKIDSPQKLIDAIEDIDDEEVISVDYPGDLSSCTIEIAGVDNSLYITSHSFSIKSHECVEPKSLIESFNDAQVLLINTHELRMLPFKS